MRSIQTHQNYIFEVNQKRDLTFFKHLTAPKIKTSGTLDCEILSLEVLSLCTIEKTQFSIAKIMKEPSAQSEILTEYILELFNFSVALRMH